MTNNTVRHDVFFHVQTNDVYNNRLNMLDENFPVLEQGEMSDEEYLQALQNQYLALRQQEYEYATLTCGYDMYNFSRNCTVDECKIFMFQNSDEKALELENQFKEADESAQELESQFRNYSRYAYTITGDSIVYNADKTVEGSAGKLGLNPDDNQTYAHCAQTAAIIATSTCNRLGLNDVTDDASVTVAAGIHGGMCLDRNNYILNSPRTGIAGARYTNVDAYNNGVTLGELVKNGEIKPGAIVSEYVGNTGSKMHALTVIGVQRNNDGDVIGYTLMDNNGGSARTRVRYCEIGGDDDISISCNNKKVVYTNVGDWANEQFKEEMNGKSIEELQSMITQRKEECQEIIADLATQERTLLCDETYKDRCGGVNRAANLALQQNQMMDYYYKNQYMRAADIPFLGVNHFENVVNIEDDIANTHFEMGSDGKYSLVRNDRNEQSAEYMVDDVAMETGERGENAEGLVTEGVSIASVDVVTKGFENSEKVEIKEKMIQDREVADIEIEEILKLFTERRGFSQEGLVSNVEFSNNDKKVYTYYMKKDRENSDDASAMVASNEINNEHSNANDKKSTIKSIDFKNMRALLLSQRS